jgi:ElaB/YqjD/DUF883 family membrane-anchored ribosome-binding protein
MQAITTGARSIKTKPCAKRISFLPVRPARSGFRPSRGASHCSLENSMKTDTKIKDALDHVRASAQELHGAISNAVAQRGEAAKGDIEGIGQKAKALAESLKASIGAQNEAVKKHLKDAVTNVEAAQKHIAEGVKGSGKSVDASIRQSLADARLSVQKLSEAVAAKRAAQSKPTAQSGQPRK